MTALRNLTALLVEPHAGMRTNIHNMLNLCGITNIEHAVSSSAAIKPLKNKAYDLILCEYDLGDGQDGQHLLEDLRHNKIIPLWTAFIIVTAERSYEKVVSAAEFTPTDYILKPFTADTLLDRIGRAIEKRSVMMPIYLLIEQGNLPAAIAECESAERAHPRHAIEIMRMRAELLLSLGQPEQAEPIYQRLLETRTVAWARLGLAKTLYFLKQFEQSENLLTQLVAENSRYMDAYDWLARTFEATGQIQHAKNVLQEAVRISPHAVRRLRKLGEIALEANDFDTAERSFQKVVSKAKYSEFKDPEDNVRLVQTLIGKGDPQQAATVIRDMDKSLGHLEKMPACRAISAGMLYTYTGNSQRAMESLNNAVSACRETTGLSNTTRILLAKHCLQNNLEEHATEIMLSVMGNTADSASMAKATQIYEELGRKDLADRLIKESRRQVVEYVSAGAEKAKNGDYRGAVELMTAAAAKLPDNPQVVFNAAVAILKYLEHHGWETKYGDKVKGYIDTARRLDPANPRLTPLMELHQSILKKYGIKAQGRRSL